MRTTVNIDDDLLARAADLTGIDEKSRLVNTVFKRFVRAEAAKRLARLGGNMPDLMAPDDVEGSLYSPPFVNEPS